MTRSDPVTDDTVRDVGVATRWPPETVRRAPQPARDGRSASWVRFLAGRLAGAVLTLLLLSALVFAATDVLPGDAAGVIAGPQADPAQRAAVRAALGLDRPAAQRYAEWLTAAVHGDLGHAYVGGQAVSTVLLERLPASLVLAGLAYLLIVPLGVGLGAAAGWSAVRAAVDGTVRRGADRVISTATLTLLGIPDFVVAILLLTVLSGALGLLPAVSVVPVGEQPWQAPETLVLPVLAVAVGGLAVLTRLVRASVVDLAGAPFVEAAALRGASPTRLMVRHVLPAALRPATAALASSVGPVVGGAVAAETVFDYPGVGRELTHAVTLGDLPLVQGLALSVAAVSLLALLAADVVGRLVDPVGARR